MILNLNKREMMKRVGLLILCFFINTALLADSAKELENIDKLDVLDKQSKEFFKAITGLEKDYLEEQISSIKNKKDETANNPNQTNNINNSTQSKIIMNDTPELSPEDYEKNVFKHQNEMARLTTDFTRTKKLKDIKIKSMYSFNGKDYVVLELDNQKTASKNDELSSKIEGRYIVGDYILGHKIVSINTRTKNLELYKKLDDEYGYYIYLSNYGISVSDLKKIVKSEKKVQTKNTENKKDKQIKNAFEKIEEKESNINLEKKVKPTTSFVNIDECLYTVNITNLNVRNRADLNATILRILKINDQFTIKEKRGDWVQLNTIYKKLSGDVMPVENESNWLMIIDGNVSATNKNCM